ncbi:DUF6153 family protein [Streptomyces sp. NPDC012888]|uniref:DUF6153 family protein n=1 Tax=Streptomyces sp. NPDC012888 TaxID=3364855 RepID=UPI00369DE1E4
MIAAVQPTRRRPAGRGVLLLVLAVVAGVLAMHGLGPGSVPTAAHHGGDHGRAAHRTHATHATHDAQSASARACSHSADGSGHVRHADATCAAAGIATPYAPPAPAEAPDGVPPAAEPAGRAAEATQAGRAPPDLTELQLLRI